MLRDGGFIYPLLLFLFEGANDEVGGRMTARRNGRHMALSWGGGASFPKFQKPVIFNDSLKASFFS